MSVQRISSGGPWEDAAGYSRAVVAGPWVVVAGTTSTVDGVVTSVGDAHGQTMTAFGIALAAARQAGAELGDTVQTRMYVTDMTLQHDVLRAHRELFGGVRPAATMVGVCTLIHPDLLVEVELTAYREPPR